MTRFWTRVIRSIQPFKKQRSKKLPVISLNDFKSLSHLNESIIYSPHLLNISALENACNALLLNISKNTPYWMIVNPFVQTWYLELERIHKCSQNSLSLILQQIEALSQNLFEISSPFKNKDKKTLKTVKQLTSICLEEWPTYEDEKTVSNTDSLMRPERYHPQVFYDTACYQRMKTEVKDRQFNAYFKGLENRLGELANTSNTKINEFMHQIIQLQRDFYLFHSFVTTQFDMLWELGDISLQHPLLLDHATLDTNLIEAIKSAWQKRYEKNLIKFQKLEDQLKTLLKQCSPSPDDFKCAVCLSILSDPITLSGCHHTFCKDCIQHIYCATCHRNHRHDSYKATTAVVCTCQRIHSITGEPTTEEKPIVRCPLCRTEFQPKDCRHDKALSKFISLYFPKPPVPKHKMIASKIQRWSNQPSYYFDDDIFSLVARHSWMF